MSSLNLRKLKTLIPLLAVAVSAAVTLTAASVAQASPSQVVADCNQNGHLTRHYSRKDLQGALNTMGADTREYTNCYDVIRRALLASAANSGGGSGGSSGSGGSGGSGGAFGSGALSRFSGSSSSGGKHHGHGSVSTLGVYSGTHPIQPGNGSNTGVPLNGANIKPGTTGVNAGSSSGSLPAPLIGAIVLLGLVALGGAGIAVRRRVLTRHGT
jgi:hypothetical protein